ncbi:uncharacterized protein LOC120485411 [Pimephales promelas]|uniref:uncharacterized protein LOC120485411 n=1 Tax=Pimephales promelas TaxID=90988 RepID=UPI001955577C|nr:uncharacterized protein LOC120485411 [Pimephales promelas]
MALCLSTDHCIHPVTTKADVKRWTKSNGTIGFSAVPWPDVCDSLIIPYTRSRYKVQSSFQVCYLHLESVAVNSQYEIERAVTISEASHHQAEKKNKSIREIAKILGVAKSTVWNILKKKERTGELSNTKRPGRPRKTTVLDDRRILSLVKKTPFTTVNQIKNTLQEVGVCVSKSTIKRRLHQSKYRGFTTRCKPLVSLKYRKARLQFAKQHLKKPPQFWNNILWTDETKINLHQSDGKRRGKELLMIQSIPPHQ